jgi:hypothetical protein
MPFPFEESSIVSVSFNDWLTEFHNRIKKEPIKKKRLKESDLIL